METNTEFDNLTALTGAYPFQHDPDVCPRCGASRSAILQRVMSAGEVVAVDCQACRLEVYKRIQRYQEAKSKE